MKQIIKKQADLVTPKIRLMAYNSADEFLADVSETGLPKEKAKSEDYRQNAWQGSDSYEHMLEIVQNPVEFTKYVNEFIDEYNTQTEVTQMGMQYDVSGDYVDVGMFLSNEPECMVQFTNETVNKGYATVAISLNEGGDVSANIIHRKALMIASTVASLEEAEIRTQVIVCFASKQKSNKINIESIKVKDFDQLFEINQLSCIHTSFYRRGYFRWVEKYYPNMVEKGYGRPSSISNNDVKNAIKEYYGINENDTFIALGSYVHGSRDYQEALKRNSKIKDYAKNIVYEYLVDLQ